MTDKEAGFEVESLWENPIVRLCLHRRTVKTLTRLETVGEQAKGMIANFDGSFAVGDKKGLRTIRDMIEHFDDCAAGVGRGPATGDGELDPWRTVTREKFESGRFTVERASADDAATCPWSDAKRVSDAFIARCRTSR